MKYFYISLLSLYFSVAQAADAQIQYSACAQTISIKAKHIDATQLLTQLADRVNFTFISSPKVSHTVSVKGEYAPKRLLQKILKGQNHFISSRPSQQCQGSSQVFEVALLAPGESMQSENLTKYLPKGDASTKNYRHIDDMQEYVEKVHSKQRKAKKAKMTPEQRAEFMRLKKSLKKGKQHEDH